MNVEKYFDIFLKEYNNYKDYWNYEDGCVLIACKQMHEATGNEKYLDFIIKYLQHFIGEDGVIEFYEMSNYNIDSINAGKVLFYVYEKTGEEKYRSAIEFLSDRLKNHPRCVCGNFWHKEIYPNQIWLDGLYMAQPFYMEYETKYNKKANYADIVSQYRNVRKYLYNDKKGLYYHAYDEAKVQPWCNKTTGCSPNFWLRSMGWYLISIIDTMDAMSEEIYEYYDELARIFREAIKGILNYQDEKTGMFYQVIDSSKVEGNYVETSGSSMVAYAILKGCLMNVLLEEKYVEIGKRILEGIIQKELYEEDGKVRLHGICHVAGLGPGDKRNGSVEYYLSEKIVRDDSKGTGPFMMAYAQYLMLDKESRENHGNSNRNPIT